MICLRAILIVYDMQKGMQNNPRRVQFTKGLYGYYYEWETKSGKKRRRRAGLLDDLSNYEKVGESAILLINYQEEDLDKLSKYFKSYSDVITARAFEVIQEVDLYETDTEHRRRKIMPQE